MERIILIAPSKAYSNDIMKYRKEFILVGDSLDGCGNLRACKDSDEWFNTIELLKNEATCPKGKVTSDTYLAVEEKSERLVGIMDFRHSIEHPILSEYGGHIGYSVRPCERNKGFGTQMLSELLPKCKEHGLSKVLITCLASNIASQEIIRKNQGVFERVTMDNSTGAQIYRYWISLTHLS